MTTAANRFASPASVLPPHSPVVVIGAGQAGLAVSHELSGRGVDHVVLERSKVAQSWRDRWDSFCLVTPNWTMSLPGSRYAGEDPEGFVSRDEIVGYLERYSAGLGAPIFEGVGVDTLEAGSTSRFLLRTTAGEVLTDSVVVHWCLPTPARPEGDTRSRLACSGSAPRTTETPLPFRSGRC